jgi:hypothetical protein
MTAPSDKRKSQGCNSNTTISENAKEDEDCIASKCDFLAE